MKKLLFTMLMLMVVAPFASPQRLSGKGGITPTTNGQRSLSILPARPGVAPKALVDVLNKDIKREKGNLSFKRANVQRVSGDTVVATYSTSYDQYYYSYYMGTVTWATTFTFVKDSVTIDGILDGMYGSECYPVKAAYSDGKITIPTSADNPTILAEESSSWYGNYSIYLFGGDLNEDGETIDQDDEVILYVADDYSTIDNGDKLIGCYYGFEDGSVSMKGYNKGLVWDKLVDGPANTIDVTELDFGEVMYSQKGTLTFTIKATGGDNVVYHGSSSDSHFTVSPTHGQIDVLGSETFTVTFAPGAIGEYSGTITMYAGDSTYTINCKGVGIDIPRDFSDLVTKGDASRFSWINNETYPWTITDGVAQPGNTGDAYTSSPLTGVLTCPAATRITFDYNFKGYGQDTLFVKADDHVIGYLYTDSKTSGTFSFMVSSGTHNITWELVNGAYAWNTNQYCISNVQLDDAEEFELVSPDASVTDMAMDGASNYNGTIYRTAADGTFTMNVAPNGAAAISFDVTADAANPVTVAVDGTTVGTITEDDTYYYNFTTGGSHTVVATLGGDEAAIDEVFVTDGEFTEVTKTYMLSGTSYLNTDGQIDLVNGKKLCYPVTVTATPVKVYFENLVLNDEVTEAYPMVGYLKDGVITISTPKTNVDGTLYGLDDNSRDDLDFYGYYNNRYWLKSGTLESLEDYNLKNGWVDELQLTCNDDMSRMTANTGFGIWATWSWWYSSSIIEFLQPGAVLYETTPGEIKVAAGVDTLDFGTVFAASSSKAQAVTMVNLGDATDFEAYIDGTNKAMFTVTPTTGTIAEQSGQDLTVTYTPTRTGSHTAKLVVVTEGNEVEVVLKGEAIDLPDFNEIVTEGVDYIRGWDTSTDYPWYVEDGIAYNGNTGIHNTTSKLTADIIVPEGYYARVSADVKGFPEIYDGVYVTVDDETIESFNQLVKYGDFGRVVDEGEHTLSIWLTKDAGDNFLCDDQAQISDVRIRLYAKGSDVAMVQKPNWYFQNLVEWDRGDSIWVALVNKGTNVLTVNGAIVPEPFRVEEIEDVPAGETGYFLVYMDPCEVGTYDKTIILNTSAGDVEFDVAGTTDLVRYLGNYNAYAAGAPICCYYNMYHVSRHYVESVYEASWLEGLEGAKFTDMTFFTKALGRVDMQSPSVSWNVMEIESPDSVPMDADNPIPDGLFNVYEGEQLDVEGYELTIPFNEPYKYQGGNFMYFAEQLAAEPFAYSFYWNSEGIMKEDGTDDYYSKVTGIWVSGYNWQNNNYRPIMRVRYTLSNGVDELAADKQLQQGDGYTYDLMGRRVNPDNLAPGIYIRNGKKFMVK